MKFVFWELRQYVINVVKKPPHFHNKISNNFIYFFKFPIKRQDTIIHVKALQNQTPPNELHGLYLAFQILVFSNISLFKDEDFTSWFFPFFSF